MEQFQGPGACLVVERIIREGRDDASQEKGQSCLFVLERYRERSISEVYMCSVVKYIGAVYRSVLVQCSSAPMQCIIASAIPLCN